MKRWLWLGVPALILIGLSVRFSPVKRLMHAGKAELIVWNWERQGSLQEADLIFQQSRSSQSRAIAAATHSRITHCGLLTRHNGQWMVLEAVQPVKLTPLAQWIRRGKDGICWVKRLKTWPAGCDAGQVVREAERFVGKPYDLAFGWSDARIYCSELIYKAYERGAGVRLGQTQTLSSFDLTHPAVQAKLRERYGHRVPMAETVIAPEAVFKSTLLTEAN